MRRTAPIEFSLLNRPVRGRRRILPWTHIDDPIRRDVIAVPRAVPVADQLLLDLGVGHLFAG